MNHLQANLCLLCVTFCWSTEVIIFACIPNTVSPFATTSITFLAGGILLLIAFARRIIAGLKKDTKKLLLRCVFLSAINGAYNTMFQFGLKDFDVSTGAFTLSLTVVALPVIMLAQRSKVDNQTWFSSALVLVGIIVPLTGMLTKSQIPGLTIIVIGCVLRAFYIIKLNQYAREHDPIVFSTLICLSGGVMSFLCWMVVQPGTFLCISWSPTVIASLAIYSYFVVALAITLNLIAQRRATPADCAIIYSLEIVFSVLWGALLPASLIDPVSLTPRLLIGIVFVVLGNLVVIFDFKQLRNKRREAGT